MYIISISIVSNDLWYEEETNSYKQQKWVKLLSHVRLSATQWTITY